jgi:hypothetical protein
MRKVLVPGVITIIAILLAGGVLLGKRIWSQYHAPSPTLELHVDRTTEVTLLQGSPLIFTVSLVGSRRSPRLSIGTPGHPWYSHVGLESIENPQPLPWKVLLLSSPRSMSYSGDASGRIAFETGGDEALVGAGRFYTLDLGIDPEEATRIHQGRYMVRAVLDLPFWPPWKWIGRVVSTPVTVNIVTKGDTTALTVDLERKRLIKSINFYLEAKQFENAYEVALQFKDREPRGIYTYLLLGDALNGLRRYQEALEAYDYALHLAAQTNTYEPPEYLLMRKHEVERRLEGGQ